jgi:hypothetical protein
MKTQIIAGALAISMAATSAGAVGCISGAVVGGVAGHVAHHHALMGAAAGCVVRHEIAVHNKKKREAEARAAHQAAAPGHH